MSPPLGVTRWSLRNWEIFSSAARTFFLVVLDLMFDAVEYSSLTLCATRLISYPSGM